MARPQNDKPKCHSDVAKRNEELNHRGSALGLEHHCRSLTNVLRFLIASDFFPSSVLYFLLFFEKLKPNLVYGKMNA